MDMSKRNEKGDAIWTFPNGEFPQINFECFRCGQRSEGFSVCLKCDNPTYEVIEMDTKKVEILDKDKLEELTSMLAKEMVDDFTKQITSIAKLSWNAAIEAAAEVAETNKDDCDIHGLIRKLKINE